MPEYIFELRRSPDRDCFAQTDLVGGAVILYLGEFHDYFSEFYAYGDIYSDIIWSMTKAILIHEDIHIAVQDCVDSNGDQEHESIYRWIKIHMDN